MNNNFIETIKKDLLSLQHRIVAMLQQEDPQVIYTTDHWQRGENNGGGCTIAFQESAVIEKAGVNFSHVWGEGLPAAATTNRPQLVGHHFQVLGLSVIIHPKNPYAPTCHFNLRFFTAEKSHENATWWFGGGFDLTPYYGFEEDCKHWHHMAQQACLPYGDHVYPRFKKWADDYFYLPHRKEPRGIGGIFFDDLNEWPFEQCLAFINSVGEHFILAYQPILARRKNIPYGKREREFQCYRRGRYVEFNLIYDRGTLFGLKFGGRIESILISLPPTVEWRYDWQPQSGSDEEKLYQKFLIAKDWLQQ